MAETLPMTQKERDRLHVVRQIAKGQVTISEAAIMLEISERQCYRSLRAFRHEGDGGLIHRLRGRPSNRGLPQKLKRQALDLYRARYPDYGPLLFAEVLRELWNKSISKETLRQWLLTEGLWQRARKGRRHRKKRPRREQIGALVQVDGSHHAWFEERGPACCLFVFVDDASSQAMLYFAPTESEQAALEALGLYITRHGIPHQIYVDRHSVYCAPAGLTNFARAAKQLGIEIIHAYSPQAKGRVERANRTHQDRLVKALRQAGICDIASANAFLEAEYLEAHNRRFARTDGLVNAHKSIAGRDLRNIICYETTRAVYPDMTFRFKAQAYQIQLSRGLLPVPRQRVTVRHWLNGSMHVFWKEQELAVTECVPDLFTRRQHPVTPADTHPWRHKPIGRARTHSIPELCRR